MEGSFTVTKSDVINWIKSGIPDTFLDDRIDFMVLSSLVTYDTPGKGKNMFSTNIIKIITTKIKNIRKDDLLMCLQWSSMRWQEWSV